MTKPIPLLATLALLAACQTTPSTAVLEDGDLCGASGYAWLVGKKLAAVTLPANLGARMIGPDTAVTMDYRPNRLNISFGRNGVIDRVYCG